MNSTLKLLALTAASLALAACGQTAETATANETTANAVDMAAPNAAETTPLNVVDGNMSAPEPGMMNSPDATDAEEGNEVDRGNPENRGAQMQGGNTADAAAAK